ncbi:MAG TPA: TRAP transporter small permease subunit [Dehalococcoidia bacterium]|nr:TRAP transporter small permease subunit [Dehalococcoidia bacterium]
MNIIGPKNQPPVRAPLDKAITAYVLRHGRHVSLDFVTRRLAPRARASLELFCYLLFFFLFVSVLAWHGAKMAWVSWSMWEHTQSPWGPPLSHEDHHTGGGRPAAPSGSGQIHS